MSISLLSQIDNVIIDWSTCENTTINEYGFEKPEQLMYYRKMSDWVITSIVTTYKK